MFFMARSPSLCSTNEYAALGEGKGRGGKERRKRRRREWKRRALLVGETTVFYGRVQVSVKGRSEGV